MDKQLADLKGEIDVITPKIEAMEAERKAEPDAAEKTRLDKSLDVLNSRLEGLLASRDKLFDALVAAPAPGKNTHLTVDASVPPSICEHATPPLLCVMSLIPYLKTNLCLCVSVSVFV